MYGRSVNRLRYLCAQVKLYRPTVPATTPAQPIRGYADQLNVTPTPFQPAFSDTHQLNEEFLVQKKGLKAKVLDGKKLAEAINKEVADEIKQMVANGQRAPNLVAVLVGDDPASQTYVSNKFKAAEKCGMKGTTILKDSSMTEEALLSLIDELNHDPGVDGILIQLPLPPHIHEKRVMQSVIPGKDVDGFHIHNIGTYCSGDPGSALIPATPLGVLEMIKRCNFPTYGKTVCIANRSKNIGFTLNTLLHSDGTGDATVLQTHRYTPPEQLEINCRQADIVITACGIPKLIRADMIKEGAMVIDVGITRIKTESGKMKIVGDVDYEPVAQKAGIVTPVPGGVGPLTVAMVIRNTLYIAQKNLRFDFKTIYEGDKP